MAALAAGLGFSTFSSAQSVTTTPVGAVSTTFPANSLKAFSLQLEESSVSIATLSSVSTNTITSSTSNWTSGAFAAVDAPYGVRITSGTYAGVMFVITGNTTNQLTVQTDGVDLTTVLSGTETVSVIPLDTLGTLFGTSSVPFKSGTTAASADVIFIWSGTGWLAYFHNGTNWRRSGSGLNQNNTVIPLDVGLFIQRKDITDLSLTITGNVRSASARRFIKPNASTFLANPFPVDMTFANSGFRTSNAWQTGASAAAADSVYLWNGTGWQVYFHNGTSWRRAGSGLNQDATAIPAGSPMFVLRRSNPAYKDSVVTHTTPYTL